MKNRDMLPLVICMLLWTIVVTIVVGVTGIVLGTTFAMAWFPLWMSIFAALISSCIAWRKHRYVVERLGGQQDTINKLLRLHIFHVSMIMFFSLCITILLLWTLAEAESRPA